LTVAGVIVRVVTATDGAWNGCVGREVKRRSVWCISDIVKTRTEVGVDWSPEFEKRAPRIKE
jgi:hypothetical protein